MSRHIVAGDGLLVGDRCIVRPQRVEGVVEALPTCERRTYQIRVQGELLEREWLLVDRITPPEERHRRNPAGVGQPARWDAHPNVDLWKRGLGQAPEDGDA